MPDDVKISEMSEAASLDNSAQFPYVQSMNGNLTTLKAPLTQIGTKINESMTFSNLQTTSKTIVGAINEAAQAGGVDYATELPISSTDPTNTKSYIDTKTTLIKSASGSLVHITDGGDNIPMKSCEITIAPDLSGHTEANLVVCGSNIFKPLDISTINKTRCILSANGQTYTMVCSGNDAYIGEITSVGSSYSVVCGSKNYLKATGSLTITISDNLTKNYICFFDKNDICIYSSRFYGTVAIPENAKYFTLRIGELNSNGKTYTFTVMANYGETAEDYVPYIEATTYNIPFGTTIYGGSGNLISGEFEQTFGFVEFDGSNDEDWHLSSSYDWNVYINIPSSKPLQFGDMLLCKAGNNLVPTTPGGYIEENKCNISTNRNFQIGILGTLGITTLEDWRTWLSSNHVKVAFTLETPTSLTPTPVNPKTISGINNIYNDCGDTAIEYFTSSADGLAALIEVLSNS